MILVDDRIGSADLIGHLRHWAVPCQMERLEFGDVAFTGQGKNGPVAVGVEIKKLHDALSCIQDGRFAGTQLPGLVRTYDRIWLILEGQYTVAFNSGLLLAGKRRTEISHGQRRFMHRELDNWLTTMEVCAGLRFRRTTDRVETARCIANLYGWHGRPFGDHKAHLALHQETPDYAQFVRPPVARMVAAQLPGIGYKKSLAVVEKFGSVAAMAQATVDEWAEIDGIGETIATRVHNAIRSR